MKMIFRNKYKILVILFIASGLLFSCKSRAVKPKPEGDLWAKCSICKGYGTIVTYKIDEPNIERRDKDEDELYGGCLGIFFSGSEKADAYEDYIEEQKAGGRYRDPYAENKQLTKKLIKCNICNGMGWVPHP